MTGELRALGICMHRANGQGSCVAHPSAFTANWSLKLGPPLQSSWAVQDSALANLYTSVLVNLSSFCSLLGGVYFSVALHGSIWDSCADILRQSHCVLPIAP